MRALHCRWYAIDAPPQVAASFVLQWLLQVPAHTAAYAAASGPWRAELAALTSSLGPSLVPESVRLTALVPDAGPLEDRLDRAERDYRAVAEPVAAAYPSIVRLGPHTRAAMVDDMWQAGAARGRVGGRAAQARRPAAGVLLPHLRAAGVRRVRRVPAAPPSSLTSYPIDQ